MSIINVQEKQIVTTVNVTKVEILEGNIQLNQSARFPVRLLNEDGNLIGIEFVTIEGEDYTNWSDDDAYITTLILNKLGITAA
jgi:hypothetical protein